MKCLKCQTENKEGAKFCLECGHRFEIKCPQCGRSVPLGAKFCDECGHALSFPSKPAPKELSFDEKLRKIQKYLPSGLTEKILSQREKIEGERRQVTVMFADMQGFTPLVEKLGPEKAYSVMDQVYEILIHKVHDYEGTVNEMTGDGIMALFGAPIALEDAPQRAIRSALAIHREITRFNDRMKQRYSPPPLVGEGEGGGERKAEWAPIRMRIGIHTGPVVVGTLGNDLRVEFKAVGDTVNLASRMEGLAEPGTTYVTDDTFKLTEGFFRFEAMGEKEIKGKEKPVKVYQVIAPSSRRTRFDVSAERGLTPFVGRERELELLLDGLERVKEGRGQAFSIMGEAGVGKSRLLYEFRKVITNEDVTFLEGKCLSYGRGTAYHPLIDILKSNFNVREDDGDFEIQDKVKRGLKVLKAEQGSTLPYLLELLSVKDSGIDRISMSPEGKRDQIIEALKKIALKGSEIRPLVMATEDLHWIDKSSEDALKYLLESIPGARVMLIFTYRPEFVHTWGGRSYHNQVTLNRLSNRESLFMAAHLLGTQEIDKDLEKLILEKTEGVPFFIEELLKSLKDLKIIERKDGKYQLANDVKAVAIPSTIQDMIMARVDSLPDATRTVLQTGSVIEREFTYDLIKLVTGLPEKQLLTHLSALKDSELIYERGIYPQTSYIFRHALTREVVHDSILGKKKKELHEEIGKGIEELYGDSLAEHSGVLAEHFFVSENYAKAAEYLRMAGRKAEKAASFPDAIAHAQKRIACLEKLPMNEEGQKKIIDARTVLGFYLGQLNYYYEAKEAIDPIIDLAIRLDYKKRLCQIKTLRGAYHSFVEENFPAGFRAFEEALQISQEIKDGLTSSYANHWFGMALAFNCEFERATRYMQRAVDISIARKTLWGIAITKGNLGYFCYFLPGKISMGFQTTAEALQAAEESGDIMSKGYVYSSHGISCFGRGLFEEAEKHLLKGIEFCERINEIGWNQMAHRFLGETYFEMGNFQKSKIYYEKGHRILEHNRLFPSLLGWGITALARTKVINHEKADELESLYAHSRNNKIRNAEGWFSRYIGEILLNIDNQHTSEAEYWIKKAIEEDKRNGMMFHLGRDYALYADFFKRKGDRLKARENLGEAIEILKECGADGWVGKYEKELALIS
jgi:class 3 adenylate cyclase/tetratricopeptide (TPR) repeat protein